MFRGREITHPELGLENLTADGGNLKDVGTLERQPMMEGRRMDIIMAPAGSKPKPKTEAKRSKTEPKTVVKPKLNGGSGSQDSRKTEIKETQNAKT